MIRSSSSLGGSSARIWLCPVLAAIAILNFYVLLAEADELADAVALQQQEQWQACLPVARKAVAARPWNERAWHALVESQLRTGQHLEAAADFTEAFRRFPSSLRLRLLGQQVMRAALQPEVGQMLVDQIESLVREASWRYTDAANRVLLGRYLLGRGADARQVLETYYDRAKQSAPDLPEPHIAIGELALDKGDFKLAGDAFQEALKRDPKRPAILLGLSRAFAPGDGEQASQYLEQALQLNPLHVPSLLEIVEKQIDGELYAEAQQTVDKILSVNPEQTEAWCALAVLAHLRGDARQQQFCRRVALGWWPENAAVDHWIGRKLSQKYRFQEGAAHQRQALAMAPDYLPAKLQLSQDLLRLGREQEGWQLANQALEQDGYNTVAHNLVQLRDHLEKFRTLESPDFLLRMDAAEADIYGAAALSLLEQARQQLCEKYNHQLRGPIVVEIFPQQADFAIRTFGLPGGDGFLGVCFGNVITANSPASQGGSPSNWAAVLWHEFCHVVTLQKTNNRMPRWLSEGISVYEERQRRRSWGQGMTPRYRQMILDGELTLVSQLSNAFLRPPSPVHLQFAYYESSLVVEFLVQEYGFESLLRMLDELGAGMPINDSLARTAGSIEALDRGFAEFAKRRAEALAPDADWSQPPEKIGEDPAQLQQWQLKHPQSITSIRVAAKALLAAEQWEEAKGPLEELIRHLPEEAGAGSARALLAGVHRQLKEPDAERSVLRQLLEVDSDSQSACQRLIELAVARADWEEAAWAAQRQMEINPLQTALQRSRAKIAEQRDDPQLAAAALTALLRLGPADPAEAHFRLARSLLQLGRPTQARREVLRALDEAPRYRDAQRLLLQLVAVQDPQADPDTRPLPPLEDIRSAAASPGAASSLLPPLEVSP